MEEKNPDTNQLPAKREDNTIYIKKSVLVVIGIIAFIALSLTLYTGYRSFFKSSKSTISKNNPTPTPDPIVLKAKEVKQETPRAELIRGATNNATGQNNEQQLNLLKSNQRGTSNIFINKGCLTSPTVAQIIRPNSFYIQNDDTAAHTIQFIDNAEWKYQVEGNKFQQVPTQQFTKGKFYQYTCDGKKETAGYIIIP